MVKEVEPGESANPTYTKWLLDAIHKVKSQKQRPSADRICHAVKQSHNVSIDSLKDQLELSVKDGIISKVLNKGMCSYRDPSSGPRPKSLKVNRKTDLTKFVVRALRNSSQIGLSIKQIEKYVEDIYSVEVEETTLSENIKASIRKGISRKLFEKDGKLVKLIDNPNAATGLNNIADEFSSDHSFCFEEENKVCSSSELNFTLLFIIGHYHKKRLSAHFISLSCSSVASISLLLLHVVCCVYFYLTSCSVKIHLC